MPMLTSDSPLRACGNAHARVEARGKMGRHLRAVAGSNAHARVDLHNRLAGGAGREPTSGLDHHRAALSGQHLALVV